MPDVLLEKLNVLSGNIDRFTKKTLDEFNSRFNQLQVQVDAMDQKVQQSSGGNGLQYSGDDITRQLKENESFSRLLSDPSRRGRAVIEFDAKQAAQIFERKTTLITSGGASLATTGVIGIERMPGVTLEARQQLTLRDVLPSSPTTLPVIDYVRVSTPFSNAQPQAEGSTKFENTVAFTSVSVRTQTIATFLKASTQLLSDMDELADFIRTGLTYYVRNAEELQFISADGTGNNLTGLIPLATAFNTGLLSATNGWSALDVLLRAQQQIMVAKEIQPSFVVLHPTDWYNLIATKDQFGRYLITEPQQQGVDRTIWGMKVVVTTNIASGTFLMGTGDSAAVLIKDRMGLVVDVSSEDSDNFQHNLITVRCEERVALLVRRPASFVTGSLTSSPA